MLLHVGVPLSRLPGEASTCTNASRLALTGDRPTPTLEMDGPTAPRECQRAGGGGFIALVMWKRPGEANEGFRR